MKSKLMFLVLFLLTMHHYGNNGTSMKMLNQNRTFQKPIKIYLLGGIVSAITQKEIDFSKKYEVVFHDFGCLAPSNLEYYELENQKVFDLLNIRFGPKWQNEIKETTLGFQKWKEKNN